MWIRIIIGIIVAGIGILISVYNQAFLNFFGPIPIAEKWFSRGSFTGYKLLGILMFFVGIFIATNIISSILLMIFGRMIPTS